MQTLKKHNAQVKSIYAKALELIEEAETSELKSVGRKKLDEALKLIEHCLRAEPTEAEFNYVHGYINYTHSVKTPFITTLAEKSFTNTLKLNPHHEFAKYFLGCLYFGQRDYKRALATLKKLKSDVLTGLGKDWMVTKAMEIALCCNFYLRPGKLSVSKAKKVFQSIRILKEMAPTPREMATCLNDLLEPRNPPQKELIQICCLFASLCIEIEVDHFLYKKCVSLQNTIEHERLVLSRTSQPL